MSFTTGIYNSSLNHLFYVCKVRVHPNGRLLKYSYPQGHTSYWFHRLRVDIQFASCTDYLTIGFVPEEITQPTLMPEELNLTCTSKFPHVIDSNHRIVSLVWHTANGSTEQIASRVDVQMSAYMRFEGTFSIADKILRCEAGSGFWCGNDTAVCVYGQMRCDQADGCFDGGTDEIGCPPPRNYTSTPARRARSSFSTYLPWTALGIVPLILLFVLGLICTPRKTLDDFDADAEADALKLNSPSSPLSSSTNSASHSSRTGSPGSTHSALLLSHADQQLTAPSQHLPRWASQPEHVGGEYELIPLAARNAKRCKAVDPIRGRCGPRGAGPELANHREPHASAGCTSRAVSFQLPSTETQDADALKPRTDVRDSCVQLVNNRHGNGIHVGLDASNSLYHGRDIGRSTRSPDSIQSSSATGGAENRLFALPAHFELAAMRSGQHTISCSNDRMGGSRGSKAVNGTAPNHTWFSRHESTGLRNKRSHVSSTTKIPATIVTVQNSWSTGCSNSGMSPTNLSESSSRSSESDREDCTPFRRPDTVGHDPLIRLAQIKQAGFGKDRVNGFVVNSHESTQKLHRNSHTRSQLSENRLSKPKFPSPEETLGPSAPDYVVL